MRTLIALCLVALFSCKSSTSEEKEHTQADTTQAVVQPAPGIALTSLQASTMPETIMYEGDLKYAYRWSDSLGDNIFFVTEKGPYRDNNKAESGEDERTKQLFARHYVKDAGPDYRLVWHHRDIERSCPLDITAHIIPGSVTITDLDVDDTAEITFLYSMACRGDITPASMKLMMIENARLYSLAGTRWVEFGPEFRFDIDSTNANLDGMPPLEDGEDHLLRTYGRYQNEKSFAGAPASFLSFARGQWIKFAVEKF